MLYEPKIDKAPLGAELPQWHWGQLISVKNGKTYTN
jgi:hypothetical protein